MTSSLAPGAAAAKYWKVPLEASTRPETRPPSACSHSSSARSGSIEMLDSRSCSTVSTPGCGRVDPEQPRQPALLADLDDDRAPPAARRQQPSAAAIVVLPTPPLPVTTSSLRSSADCIAGAVCLKNRRRAAGPTIVRVTMADARPIDEQVEYDGDGLVPCVVQDWSTGEVLTLAYMNEQALARTRETGELHLWSRSRGEQWHKGATSGNVQAVRALRLDCDGDALLALVEPAGPACHTGERTCFHRGELDPGAPYETLPALERTLAERARERPAGSYTVELLDDPPRIGEKVMEEAEEVARAAREESDERVDEEAADVLYHLLVLLAQPGTHARGCRAGARWPPLLASLGASRCERRAEPPSGRELARTHDLIPLRAQLHRGLRDARLGVPEAARAGARRAGVPARVRRPGSARRALVVHRLSPARGAALVARRRRRPVRAGGRACVPLQPGADRRHRDVPPVHRRRRRLLRL